MSLNQKIYKEITITLKKLYLQEIKRTIKIDKITDKIIIYKSSSSTKLIDK